MAQKDQKKRTNPQKPATSQKGKEEKDSPTQAYEEGEPRETGRHRPGGEELDRKLGKQ